MKTSFLKWCMFVIDSSNMCFTVNFVILICLFHNVFSSCVFQDGKYDLSLLDWPGGWPVSGTKVNGTSTYYEISICHPLNYTQLSLSQGCSKSSICQISGEKAVSFGKAIESPSDYRISDNGNTGFSLYLHTSELCGSSGVYQATISFACGPNLGAPELILWSDCQVKFFWRTSAACINKPKIRQVPCYVIDNEGNKRDLSQLILRKGGYSVAMFFSTTLDFMINICSEIFGDEGCGSNSSACRVHWNERLSFGKPYGRLQYTQKGLILSYLTDEIYPKPPKGCSLKPKTTIIFKCPQRNKSFFPFLRRPVSNCQYEIIWATEYACPENVLKGSVETCQFTAESNGVEIDLSPLIERPAYNIPSSSGNSTFALSVCVGLQNFACNGKNWNSTSVCANGTTNSSVIIGTTEGSHLIYADDIVILTYPGQESCDNDTDQSSIIKFLCDSDADNDGNGKPYHIFSDPCIHTFEWKTKHACLKPSLDSALLKWTNYCSAHFKNKTINLAQLFLERWHGKVWEAIDGRNINPKDNAKYYLNVCGQVAYISHLSSCGEGSSACVLDSSGKYLNLGNFTSPPVYDIISDSVQLTYTGGSPCKDVKRWISTINFFCRISDLVSRPILVHVDESECQYKFEWHTASACPEVFIEGANCKIHDDNIGINYDLSPLKHKVYKVDTESHKFFIRICEPRHGTFHEDKMNSSLWIISFSDLYYHHGNIYSFHYFSYPLQDEAKIFYICDFNAGNGSPHFVRHDGFSYIFHWYTSLLCTNSSTVCMVQDPFSHLIYDLSGLSIYENNWVHVVNEDNKESKVYLSICRPLTQPLICDSSAAACMVEKVGGEEKVVISNLGQPVSLPVLESPGHLILKYTNGNPCTEYSENATYSTVIHFLCAKDKMGKNDLTFLSKVGACDYAFLWRTKAACPTSVSQTFESCQLTDPDSGFTFNLTSLWKVGEPYTIKTYFNTTFQLNVCGKVESGCLSSNGKQPSENVSACKIDSEGSVRNLAVSDSYFLSYSTGRDLSITYKYFDESFDEGVIIKFPCHNTTADPHLKFVMYDDKNRQYIFEMKTPLTCIRSHFDCSVFDQYGNEYDLSPLTKYREGNWEVADSRPNHSHLRYHINICRPLNKVNGYKCPTGFSGACQTNVLQNGSIGHDLGSQMNEPLVNDKGNIVLRYTHGSYCNSGQFKRSTTVNLFCFGEHEDLKFIKETPECEYIFSLRTPVACPIQNSISGACTIKDPSFGYIFDLNPLKNKNNYYLTVGEYNFYLNVCDKLNGFKNACMNSSACQTKPEEPSFSISFGLPNDHLVYRNGVLTLEYTSDANYCHGKYSGSIKIIFTCHQALEVGPYFVSETEDCTFLFEWPTVHACPPFNVVECSVIGDNGAYYDLSRLSLPNKNYYVKHPLYEKHFVINVCRSVVPALDFLCPYASGSCLVDISNHPGDVPVNLGTVTQGPYMDNGKLKINYTSGDPCDSEGTETERFMQTVIEFICNHNSIDSKPEFLRSNGCTFYFDWHTIYACESEPSKVGGNCTVEDPFTGYLFNLSSLKNHGLFRYEKDDHRYYLSVCGSDDTSPCGVDSGMCQEVLTGTKQHWSGGKFNSYLIYSNGIVFLNYSNGDFCHNSRFTRSTLLEFHCGHGIGEPKFLHETHNCSYFFSWETKLACQTLLHCAIKNGSQYYDLTSIAATSHLADSSVLNDNTSYYISICNSLEKLPELLCPPGAAICRVQNDGSTENLGRAEYQPFLDYMGHATAIYTNGSTCLKNSNFQNHAKIIFLCDSKAGMGVPVLVTENEECYFIFEWRTSVVCPEKPIKGTNFTSCNYTDDSSNIHFNLFLLQRTRTEPCYEVTDGNSSYLLNICATLENSHFENCKDAGICKIEGNKINNYGMAASQKLTYDGERFRLAFYDGDDCSSDIKAKLISEVLFVCNPFVGKGEPVIHKKYACMTVFLWETSLACQNLQNPCAFDIDGSHYDFNLLSSSLHNFNTSDNKNTTYYINLCHGIQQTVNTFGCSPTTAVCMVDPEGLSLGMVETMKVKSFNSTDLLLTFESGDSRACSTVSSDKNLKPVTRLFMRCGSKLGHPQILSGPDDKCFYDFVWESSLACSAVKVIMEKDGIIKNPKFDYSLDIRDILNRTFIVNETSVSDQYVYRINLSGVSWNSSDSQNVCFKAAVCQTKPNTNFTQDIGSTESRTFVMRGSELHLEFVSQTQPCRKNRMKNVTTVINLQCVPAAGIGNPVFVYESGDCNYIFDWETTVACPDFRKRDPHPKPTSPFQDEGLSGQKVEIAVGVIITLIILMIAAFIFAKPTRRATILLKFRSVYTTENPPYFRYKKDDTITVGL